MSSGLFCQPGFKGVVGSDVSFIFLVWCLFVKRDRLPSRSFLCLDSHNGNVRSDPTAYASLR